ncbi:MAG: hypothetical protein JSU03_02855 [Bacteroidetes bacterium]|nr:hypothetical protein [Bacteroidota bacterium]
MKIKLLTLFVLVLITNQLFAQSAAKSIYGELGGAGLASINYDMRVMKKEDGLGFRAGVGGFAVKVEDSNNGSSKVGILTIPLEINYLLGKDSRNYFEVGAGATIVSVSNKSSSNSDDNSNFSSTFGHLYLGYRLQPKEGGFLFRAGITPIFGNGFFMPYFGGVSFGYKF